VLVVLVVLAVVFGRGDDDSAGRAAAGTSGVATSSSSGAPDSGASDSPASGGVPTPGATGSGNEPPPSLPQVGLHETAAVGDGVTVDVASVESIQGRAAGPGNVAGPALRVTVRITNGTGAELAVDAATVNLAYGDAATPGSPLEDPSRAPFSGTVAPGAGVDGVYVFSVPADAADPVIVEVGYRPGAPLVLFVGPVG
jgi:hypothetical protein